MTKKTTIIIIVIVIIVLGVILFVSNSTQQAAVTGNSPTDANTDASTTIGQPIPGRVPQTIAVSYTDTGFDPKFVVLKAGDSITWTNNSSGKLWVASDPHPTHTDLPGFDEKAVITKGGTWTYTFAVLGTHGYHNHTNHTMTGTVIVQ